MPEINPTSIQDCMTIARAFEKGANHAMTEESVFAVMTPRLSTMRSMAKATKKMMAKKSKDKNALDLSNTSAKEIDLLKECFPCKFRIDFKGKMNVASLLNPASIVGTAKEALLSSAQANILALKAFYVKALNEINSIMDMFRNLDKYVDLCAFKKFFSEFVCIPDLQRIIALLTAFLMKLAIELNGIFSLVISLFAPLLLPFLTPLVDTLTQFILAAIKPIECIIDNLQKMMTKLDYNALFQNIDAMQISLGPKTTKKQEKGGNVKLPVNAPPTGDQGRSIQFSLNPLGKAVAHAENQKVVDAQNELDALQEASLRIDGSDQAAGDENRKQITAAKQKVAEKQADRDLSAIGKANQKIEEKFQSYKGALVSMLSMLRRAAAEIEAYIRKVLDELTKLIMSFFGGGASAITLLFDKLQIVQLIALVVAIIKALKNKPKCEDEGQETEIFLNQLNPSEGFTMFTDEDGTVHIQEKDDGIKRAIEDVAKVFGVPAGGDPNEKLKSLVKFTGNDTLDSSISRAVDAMTVPLRVKFRCPLQTSVANAETVNKWIKELNSESI